MLYLGFIGMTVPFAFGMAALLTGRLSDQWIRITRRWTLFAWVCLTAGLFLGSLWSYSVLGWGGYWAWDPVENIALLPWLASTAFLHSVMVQERRGMLKVWNLSLIVATFGLTVFGTFLTRGSILASVHSFAASAVGPLYLGFLLIVLCAGFGLIAARSKQLASESSIDRLVSREGVFLGNNILLVALTATVLVGTVFPLLNEALTGAKVSVGAPYFDRTAAPVMLLLLFLMGIGPLLPWRVGSGRYLLQRLKWPVWAGALTVAGLVVTGVRHWAAVAAFGLAAFVGTATIVEMVRGRAGAAPCDGRRRRAVGVRRGRPEPPAVRRADRAPRAGGRDRRHHLVVDVRDAEGGHARPRAVDDVRRVRPPLHGFDVPQRPEPGGVHLDRCRSSRMVARSGC